MQLELSPSSETTAESTAPQAATSLPGLASIWRRVVAWTIDMLIFIIAAHLLAILYPYFFYILGPYGRLFGFSVLVLHFGLLNSRIGGGQPEGKRLLKIAVRDRNNQPVGVGRSFMRISIILLPMLFLDWRFPLDQNVLVLWIGALIIIAVTGALIYTMIFNRQARQGLHDMLLDTYVVHLPSKDRRTLSQTTSPTENMVEPYPKTARVHWIVCGVWLGIVVAGLLVLRFTRPTPVPEIPPNQHTILQETLQNDVRFFSFKIVEDQSRNELLVSAWHNGYLSESEGEEVVESLSITLLETMENFNQYDRIQIKIMTGFDLGFARRDETFELVMYPKWIEVLETD
jgi:uncharacterized RDD family membrane protein YckC